MQKLCAHPVDHGIGDRRSVAGRIDDHAERSLSERRIHHRDRGIGDQFWLRVIGHGLGKRRQDAIGEPSGKASLVLPRPGRVGRRSSMREMIGALGGRPRGTRVNRPAPAELIGTEN
jgi:hypothetical protein